MLLDFLSVRPIAYSLIIIIIQFMQTSY